MDCCLKPVERFSVLLDETDANSSMHIRQLQCIGRERRGLSDDSYATAAVLVGGVQLHCESVQKTRLRAGFSLRGGDLSHLVHPVAYHEFDDGS